MTKPKITPKKPTKPKYKQVVKTKEQLAKELKVMVHNAYEFAIANDLAFFGFAAQDMAPETTNFQAVHNVSKGFLFGVVASL